MDRKVSQCCWWKLSRGTHTQPHVEPTPPGREAHDVVLVSLSCNYILNRLVLYQATENASSGMDGRCKCDIGMSA